MINNRKTLEKFLQTYRFNKVKKFLSGDVLDFGGNEGELKPLVKGDYVVVNYDHTPMLGRMFNTIVLLAVLEHIEVRDVPVLFKKFKDCLRKEGVIFLSTPAPVSKPVLEILAFFRLLDKKNIEEHKHYWSKNELFRLARDSNYEVIEYRKFQLGFNQYLVLKHKTDVM